MTGRGRGRRAAPGRRRSVPKPDRRTPAQGLGGDQVEGRQAVRELLVAGRRRVRELLMADDLEPAPILDDITELAGDLHVRVRRIPRARLDAEARTEAPQGVVARAAPLPEADLDDLCRPVRGSPLPFLIVLDGITDPGNLGALLRTAEGAGATGVVLPRHRAAHVTPTVAKAAAGAVEYLPIALVPGVPAALARARELGVWIVGLDAGGDTRIQDLSVADEPLALVLGAEGRGLGRLTRERCDVLAAIPLRGRMASLNVAAAGAVACFEIARCRDAARDIPRKSGRSGQTG